MEENIDAVPSEDNGNVPVDAPSEQPKEEPAEVPVEEPAKVEEPAEPELYELPDGRKVDAETLSREWKDNFYPEFTRKSQELAKAKTPPAEEPENPYASPDYVPQSYAEIIKAAKEETIRDIENRQKAEVERRTALESEVGNQLAELKKSDASLNENLLFVHANKYGFKDLKIAHQNMKDMNALAKSVQQTTAKNIQKRANEPISTTPGQSTGVRPDPSAFSSAIDYLRSLK